MRNLNHLSTKLRIVAVNDIYELENLPKLKSFLTRISSSSTDLSPSAVVLAGDFLSPGELSAVDGGRGMVQALKLSGITHACLGNHEADLIMPTLEDRIRELTTGKNAIQVINTNLRPPCLEGSHWLKSVCPPHGVIQSHCGGVKVGLLGLLSDEPSLYIGGDFHHLPLGNVLESYSESVERIYSNNIADYIVALTHQTIHRDRDLARYILAEQQQQLHRCHILIGGHEHDPHTETVSDMNMNMNMNIEDEDNLKVIISKSGQDSEYASIIDIHFERDDSSDKFCATEIQTELVDLRDLSEADRVCQSLVSQKLKGMSKMEHEIIVDHEIWKECRNLCSTGSQSSETTFGSFACDAIRVELRADVATLPGYLIQGNGTYENNLMTYKQIKQELPFKIKMVCVPMTRRELKNILKASRALSLDYLSGKKNEGSPSPFLHVDSKFEIKDDNKRDNEILKVAVHMPLLMEKNENADCPIYIQELEAIGKRLKAQDLFPGHDDWIPGLYLVIRYCCHKRWSTIMQNFAFEEVDKNQDGVLDRNEIRDLMTTVLGHEPEEYALDDMIRHIDRDENGFIEREEFEELLKEMKRQQ